MCYVSMFVTLFKYMQTQEFQQKVLVLTHRVYPMVARMLGNDQEAEDGIQEIMLRLWKKRRQLKKHPNIPGFVFLTARNYCLDVLRKQSRIEELPHVEEIGLEDHCQSEVLEKSEVMHVLDACIRELPEQQREVIIWRDFDGLSYVEIAELSGLKVESIRVVLSRARKQVKQTLQKVYNYEQR